ncbi:N-acetylmuramoyl-L-alanine amidase [Salibacterium halotolerans]|uniref:N-acetylmuramoyl-L-alanine amidase n=2 Tax=Salibacterium halotolerans TaxID=1884432 RepID=A0A1I5NCM7_9BACI|nr:N-acetylmuramoyl-L-alanine amidase [Salibacterium halotolerans]
MKYDITKKYIRHGNARPGHKLTGPIFGVAHDTGNPGSTAHGNRNYFDSQQPSASAQVFIDDKYILEIIPLEEKAYHVIYDVKTDNRRYGHNANDAAIGVELCYGGGIDFNEAYKRYVWYFAYLCDRYGWDPEKDITGHSKLDPDRKTDPENALNQNGVSFRQFINDVKREMDAKGIASATDDNLLEKGDAGSDVKKLQEDLMTVGEKLPRFGADGDYGTETVEAVKAFQSRYNLTVDGVAGPETTDKLKQILKKGDEIMKPTGVLNGTFGDYLKNAADRGIIEQSTVQEYEDGEMTQSNAIALVALIESATPGTEVAEVHQPAWEKAQEEGVFNGERPNEPITRVETATVLKRTGAFE